MGAKQSSDVLNRLKYTDGWQPAALCGPSETSDEHVRPITDTSDY